MRRPTQWTTFWFSLILGALAGLMITFAVLLPVVLRLTAKQLLGAEATLESVRWQPPLGVDIRGIRLNQTEAGGSIGSLSLQLRGISLPRRIVWLSVVADNASMRLIRTAEGEFRWADLPGAKPTGFWQFYPKKLYLQNASLEVVDFLPDRPLRLLVDDVYGVASNVIKGDGALLHSAAVRGEVISTQGDRAPLACAGWLEQGQILANVDCHLDPMPLRILNPYFESLKQVRVRPYQVTFSFTGGVEMSGDQVWSNLFLHLDQLTEGNVVIRGRNVIDLAGYKPLVEAEDKSVLLELRKSPPRGDDGRLPIDLFPADDILNTYFQLLIDKDHIQFGTENVVYKLHSSSRILLRNLRLQREALIRNLSFTREPPRISLNALVEEDLNRRQTSGNPAEAAQDGAVAPVGVVQPGSGSDRGIRPALH